jgi:hypothetical protein
MATIDVKSSEIAKKAENCFIILDMICYRNF